MRRSSALNVACTASDSVNKRATAFSTPLGSRSGSGTAAGRAAKVFKAVNTSAAKASTWPSNSSMQSDREGLVADALLATPIRRNRYLFINHFRCLHPQLAYFDASMFAWIAARAVMRKSGRIPASCDNTRSCGPPAAHNISNCWGLGPRPHVPPFYPVCL